MSKAFELKPTQYKNLLKILKETVETTRETLECDRVIIYNATDLPKVRVLAESTKRQFPSILGKVIQDPFLDGDYLEMYCYGMSLTIDDIYASDISQKDIKNLEGMGIKSVAVAPIYLDKKILAFLVAHQCKTTQPWDLNCVSFLAEIANTSGKFISSIADTDELDLTQQMDEIDRQLNIFSRTIQNKEIQEEDKEILIDNHIITMLEQKKNDNGNGNLKNQNVRSKLTDMQQQLERERMWTKNFTDVIQKIRQSLQTEDILKTSVKEVHKILKCDRALIYTLTNDCYGKIVAESVSSGWTKAEGRVIKDPCFEARYLEKYRDGRVRVWNDIYEANMTSCHVEQLERLEVKANFVVPLMREGRLFGLLVAQQCSSSRQWQKTEILWLTQIATQVGFALDNAQLLADSQKLRQHIEQERIWSEYFTDTVQQIRQSLKTKDVYRASVREVRRVLNCDRVLVYSLNQDKYGEIVAESVTHGWTKAEGRVINDPCFEVRYLDKYRDGRVRVWNDIYQAEMASCYREQLENLEVKANLVVPIVSGGKLFGLLVAQQCSGSRQWQQVEIDWLIKIANQVSLAQENAQMREQIEQYTKTTQEILNRAANSSSNIQRTVQNVTVGFENLNTSCQTFSEVINQVKNLGKQLAQQSMSMTRLVNLSQAGENEQNSVIDLSDKIFSLMQELFEATAKIDPLFTTIKTEITAKTTTLESEAEQLDSGVGDFQKASQQLDQIISLNQEMSNLIKTTSDALESQIKGSTFTKDSVEELTDITERISQQSMAMLQSFNKLGRIIG